ncbi:COR domain-containing protein [Mycobacteroides chelonae]|uniref:leucine-rich repeat domain-containing protein n=1 Tax=Mycobacteroides chelonae TaxID=1774 RepID=UPI0009C10F31|nr:COR domain-containing protein [Mycobacteroides chelonae]
MTAATSGEELRSCLSEDGTRASFQNQRLGTLPDWLWSQTTLTDLDLSGNALTELPDAIGNLTALTQLNLYDNRLTGLPDAISNLEALADLTLSDNVLIMPPVQIAGLTRLTKLNLEFTRISTLPDWIGELTALRSLQLSNNAISELPDTIANLAALTRFDVGGNTLTSLPTSLRKLTALTNLDLGRNPLEVLPDWLGDLVSLTELDISACKLSALPERLRDLTSIVSLDISRNQFAELPDWLGDFNSLKTLDLSGNQFSELPAWLGRLSNLTRLNLSGIGLKELPSWLGNLNSLMELILSTNELMELPSEIGELRGLRYLTLSSNKLSSLPQSLGNLSALTDLTVSGNNLQSIPDSIGNIPMLNNLNIAFNQLVELPECLSRLQEMRFLYLGSNNLTYLPEWVCRMPNLLMLEAGNNRITNLPENLTNLTKLRHLFLGNYELISDVGHFLSGLPISIRKSFVTSPSSVGNALSHLPEQLGNLSSLEELDLGNVGLRELPKTLGELSSLVHLDLNGNQLAHLPDELAKLRSLRSLNVSDNALTQLPANLGELDSLINFNASGNRLTNLPKSFAQLQSLVLLNLSRNQLESLPPSIDNINSLSEIDISENHITELPNSVKNLRSLTSLNVNCNQLNTVPESVGSLEALDTLNLFDNPLRSPLSEISENGTTAIKAYLSSVAQQATELWISKLLVVGEGTVGKTSLIKSLVGEDYDEHEPTTHGIRINDIELPHPTNHDINMRLSSWDFGGQDIYHATHQFFLSDRSLFLLLWNSRQGWEHAKLPYWLDIIQARAPRARIILVATHTEARPVDLPLTDLKSTYPQIVDSVSVDNRTREGVDQLRQKMAEQATKLPLMGSRWPTSWVRGVDAINKCELQHATPEELYKILASVGVSDQSHQDYLLRALHLLGDILYFDDDEDLRDTVILRPQWVNSYIAKVLDSPEVAATHGLLSRSHERELWSDLEAGLRDRFLQMMEKFDLSYRITDDSTAASLVVERLPWDSPSYQEQWAAALETANSKEIRLRYQLNTIPPGVPTWFIAREHRFSTKTHWRTGALFQYTGDPRVFGLVRADHKDNVVELAVRGPVPQLFFSVLKDGFDSTLSRYQGLDVNTFVPCPCGHGDGTQPETPCFHLFQYSPLLRRLEQGVSEVECELSFTKQNVANLLFGIAPSTTDQLVEWMERIDSSINDSQAYTAWTQREILKVIRLGQHHSQSLCPSVFTLTPAAKRSLKPGVHRLELHLYCEQPGAFHALPEPPYTIEKPTRWLSSISPVLTIILRVLKHTVPLVGPVLGITAEDMAKKVSEEVKLMTELVRQVPSDLALEEGAHFDEAPPQTKLDADYRNIYALLHQLDPNHHWSGLSRVLSPENQILWLCRDHAQLY